MSLFFEKQIVKTFSTNQNVNKTAMPCCDEAADPSGPRKCTDIFCLGLFVVFWFVMIIIAAFALVYGNPLRLINGYDSFGNTCGTNNEGLGGLVLSGMDMSDKPYLFHLDIMDLKSSMKICVKQCPNRDLSLLNDLETFYNQTGSVLCRYDFNFSMLSDPVFQSPDGSNSNIGLLSPLGPCPPLPVHESFPILNRCVPRPVKELTVDVIFNVYGYLNNLDVVEQVLSDLYSTWQEIVSLSIVAFVLSFVMILLLHILAAVASWVFMLTASIAAIVGTAVLWWTYADIKKELDNTPPDQLLEESAKNERAFLAYSVVATILTVILLLLVLVMRKRIKILVNLFREAGSCLSTLPCLFLQPIATFVALFVFFIFWIAIMVCLATATHPAARTLYPSFEASPLEVSGPRSGAIREALVDFPMNVSVAEVKTFTLIEFVDPAWVRYFWWVYLIGLVWTAEFILSCQQMVIAGAVGKWYFSREEIGFPVLWAIQNLFFFHLGSVAAGSLLITVFKVPRLVLTYFQKKLKMYESSSCSRFLSKCCICCLYCLERFLKYINHNAYTVVAIEGTNFWPASRVAFTAIVNNALQVATINSVGDFVLFLGKCAVMSVTGFVGLLIMKSNPHLNFYAIPTLVVCVFSYFIAHSVLSLYEMVVDTLFLCMCEDVNLREEDSEKGYYKENIVSSLRAVTNSVKRKRRSETRKQDTEEVVPINA